MYGLLALREAVNACVSEGRQMDAAPGTAPLSGRLSSLVPVAWHQLVVHQGIWCGLVDELWVPFLDVRSGTQRCPSPKPIL